jgi:hypothetical protein
MCQARHHLANLLGYVLTLARAPLRLVAALLAENSLTERWPRTILAYENGPAQPAAINENLRLSL